MLYILNRPLYEETEKPEYCRIVGPLRYFHKLTGYQEIPAGYVTNFASVPKWFRVRYARRGKYDEESTVHDHLYTSKGVIFDIDGNKKALSRAQCDQIFFDGLQKELFDRDPSKAFGMWAGVRLGGWLRWGKKSEI